MYETEMVEKSGMTSHREYWHSDDDDGSKDDDDIGICCPILYILAYGFLTAPNLALLTWLSSFGDHIFSISISILFYHFGDQIFSLTWKPSNACEQH